MSISKNFYDLTRVGYAPGDYCCICQMCGVNFDGDKRACTCRACAEITVRDNHIMRLQSEIEDLYYELREVDSR